MAKEQEEPKTTLKKTRQWGLILAYIFVSLLVFFTLFSLAVKGAITYLDKHPEVLVSWLESHWQATVKLEKFSIKSNKNTVSLEMGGFSASDESGEKFAAFDEVYISLDWWKSLLSFSPVAETILLNKPVLKMTHHRDGHFSIANQIKFGKRKGNGAISRWLLQQEQIQMQDAAIALYSERFRKEWLVEHASLQVNKEAGYRQAVLSSTLPGQDKIGLLSLKMQWHGDLTSQWTGQLSLEASSLPLDVLAITSLSKHVTLEGVYLDVQGKMSWKDNLLESSNISIEVSEGTLQNIKTAERFAVKSFKTTIEALRKYKTLYVSVESLLPHIAKNKGFKIKTNLAYKEEHLHGQIPAITPEQLAYFLPLFASKEIQDKLAKMNIKGKMRDLSFDYLWAEEPLKKQATVRLAGEVEGVSFSRLGKVPGVKNVTASVSLVNNVLNMNINSKGLVVDFGKWFSAPMRLGDVTAEVSAKWLDTKIWEISSDNIQLSQPYASAGLSARIRFVQGKKKPFVELLGEFKANDLTQIKTYLPIKQMSPKLITWFEQAFDQGEVTRGKIFVHGDLNKYPFMSEEEGLLELNLHVKNASLHFNKGWDEISRIEGNLKIKQQALSFDGSQAQLSGINLSEVVVAIPDLRAKSAVLSIIGKANGEAQKVKRFFMHSPLKKNVEKVLADLKVSGNLTADLKMNFLMQKASKDLLSRINGQAYLHDNKIVLGQIDLPIDKINGQLDFSEHGVESVSLSGMSLGGKVSAKVHTSTPWTKEQGETQLELKGVADGGRVEKWAPFLLPSLDGPIAWTGLLKLNKSSIPSLALTSDLSGAKVYLPNLINKPKLKPMKMSLKMNWEKNRSRVKINAAPFLTGELLKYSGTSSWLGGLAFKRATLVDNKKKLVISARLKQLDLSDWERWLDKKNKGNSSASKGASSLELAINADKVTFGGSSFRKVKAHVLRNKNAWHINMSSKQISGEITVPDKQAQEVKVHLLKFKVGSSKAGGKQEGANNFIERPIALKIDSLFVDNKQVGVLSLFVRPTTKGVQLNKVQLKNKDYSIKGEGSWNQTANKTKLNLEFKGSHLQQILRQFSYTGEIEKASLNSTLALNWQGVPTDFSLVKLNGVAKFNIGSGVLGDVDASSGKVFGIIGLHTLDRRLRGDAKDLTKKGLDFDSVKGSFVITKGLAKTKGVRLKSSTVNVVFVGQTNLVKQSMNFNLDVRPRISDSLPVVGAVTAGIPGAIVGGVIAVIDKITNHGIDKMARQKYRLTGQWKSPKVVKKNR